MFGAITFKSALPILKLKNMGYASRYISIWYARFKKNIFILVKPIIIDAYFKQYLRWFVAIENKYLVKGENYNELI